MNTKTRARSGTRVRDQDKSIRRTTWTNVHPAKEWRLVASSSPITASLV